MCAVVAQLKTLQQDGHPHSSLPTATQRWSRLCVQVQQQQHRPSLWRHVDHCCQQVPPRAVAHSWA